MKTRSVCLRAAQAACAVTALSVAGGAAAAEQPRQVYCYAFGMAEGEKLLRLVTKRTLYVSPIFESNESEVVLEVEYRQSVPEAGLATCVTDEYESDLQKAWDDFVALTKADGTPLVITPLD
jgi:hypothetical protein